MIQLFTPKHRASDSKAYGYVTDGSYTWEQRSYISDNDAAIMTPIGSISKKNDLSWDGANSEAYLDDIMVADASVRNPMWGRNGERMCYGLGLRQVQSTSLKPDQVCQPREKSFPKICLRREPYMMANLGSGLAFWTSMIHQELSKPSPSAVSVASDSVTNGLPSESR